MFINYLLEQKCQIICCEDDAQPPPFFGEMPHDWLKERADYYEEVLTDYRAKCPKLQELKKKMRRQNNRVQSDLFREALLITENGNILKLNGSHQIVSYQHIYFPEKLLPKDA